MDGVTGWEKATAIATAAGGIGAMLGALAAWRAAKASGRASADARDALAASLKPHVEIVIGQDPLHEPPAPEPVFARAIVVGALMPAVGLAAAAPAVDVRIEFSLASGGHGYNAVSVLEPTGDRFARKPPYLGVEVGKPNADWPPPEAIASLSP